MKYTKKFAFKKIYCNSCSDHVSFRTVYTTSFKMDGFSRQYYTVCSDCCEGKGKTAEGMIDRWVAMDVRMMKERLQKREENYGNYLRWKDQYWKPKNRQNYP